ncbi:dihydroxy-acid dehydratase [Aeromicrobium piscarium]|uniref:Dihydroxy-acid dehydratase n=1 Tax=Aeromicrobium piscarium TaxID=2590901 RepID=A0A554RWF8_9ACTN|nr:dihydroxy-acid dehydratase [Aeromicrobium piscarium]TSD58417.1 dihydroxy-acid dehydratase [Aeromicrobium piscarium]
MTGKLRSSAWLDGTDEAALLHRAALRSAGATPDGRPVIGIADTASDLNPCNLGLRDLIDPLRSAIEDAGGTAVVFPVMSLGEDLMKPSAMLYRNLAAMELEETARAYPLDGLVLLANCDKTVPAALMAAASADLPALLLLGGPRTPAMMRGRRLGSGTDLWRMLDERRTGRLGDDGWAELEHCLGTTTGACNTMGTASTMALLTEALAMTLPGAAGLPAWSTELAELATRTGRRVVEMVREDIRPQRVITQAGLDNALRVLAAVGGSTNAIIHLAAIAGRLGLDASLDHAARIFADIPLLADVEPCGARLMQDFVAAGGLGTLLKALGELADPTAPAADGRTVADVVAEAPAPGEVIRPRSRELAPAPTMAVVRGSLAPDGAVIKVAAASRELLRHTGPARVFSSYEDMRERMDDEASAIGPDAVLVMRGCGPVGAPGMPEWGMVPVPEPLARAGVTDMVRISDGRMSGTSFGTVVLHVAPESEVGGPLALVEDGDLIALDVPAGRIDLLVDGTVLEHRRQAWSPRPSPHRRGWPALYRERVLQAPEGADFDVLAAPTPDRRRVVPPVVGRS